MLSRSRDDAFCDDTPVQPENEHGSKLGFWTQFRFAQQNGYAREFLASARRFQTAPACTIDLAESQLEDLVSVRREQR